MNYSPLYLNRFAPITYEEVVAEPRRHRETVQNVGAG